MSKRQKSKVKSKNFGFTLIELLVVMAILGFLSVIAFGAFRNSQIKGRDAQRKHDLGQLSKALEMYYNDKERYPDESDLPPIGEVWQDGVTGAIYIKSMVYDPSGDPYCYTEDPDGNGIYYELYAKLENSRDAAIEQTCGAGGGACSCNGDPDYNYRVTSLNRP